MKPTMYFLMNSIDLERGGLTRASLKQASFFAEMGYDTYMLTFNFNPKYPRIRKKLLEMNKVHKDVTILNMYEEFEGFSKPLVSNAASQKVSLDQLSEGHPFDIREGYNAYRIYKNGIYTKYIALNKDNSLDFIDYFNENRYRTKREVYDLWGNLKKVSYMDLVLNKPRQLIYYDNDGRAYLTQWNNPGNGKVQRILLFNEDSSIRNTFVDDDVSHKVDWLTKVVNRIPNEKSVIVSDTRSTDEVLINFKHPKAATIWRLHSSHLDEPFEVDSPITSKVKAGMENIEKFDAAVFLTEEQKRDIISQVGHKSPYQVIPHYHEDNKKSIKGLIKNKSKNTKLGIVVSRLSTLKRIDHIIKAFQLTVEKVPDAQLEIWGKGDQEANLEKLIKNLKLENNVFLKGYTHNPDDIYQKGIFSVLTSKKEGFALSVMESMYNKTPVISYDIKYGPNDMIVNDENGFIVESGNIEELGAKMTYMFENPQKAIKMGKQGNKYIENHFSKKIYKEKWLEVVDFALNNKFQ
ncbi:hypothetical protein CFK37_08185 [Virgibacillus phasianinus]|uniref:Glycosyl transferase family 1 domain-containing protein n=1 Tax=Virgibacillus phasianinus TaxID=2017483 RepID=A0A220U1M7_9BACI|nr:glycosyltransferase [Virgibacillus phasianinus]ASK62144.1 hypothetical protein CFK37_08185 [Virgibacillus phasianinus]